ncbi:MAG TPA: hypothetical protein VJQ82_08580 [Terriglobales bacterium]|nr:hypothetical protein [Terriglobales bacterium]
MGEKLFRIRYVLILATLGALLSFGTSAVSQTAPAQNPAQPNPDITRTELAHFDQFLDNHPETAEQLRKDPSLINDKDFIKTHTELQEFLEQHPGVREELRENPDQFMHREQRFDRREDADRDRQQDQDFDRNRQQHQGDQDRQQDFDRDRQQNNNDVDRDRQANNQRHDDDTTRRELANFDGFLDSHPEIAEQLRKDPSLVNDRKFVKNHEDLAQYLDSHPGVKEEYREHPNQFMSEEQRFDRHEDFSRRGDNDVTRRELANFDGFLDSHPEIAEQLRKDPSLVNDRKFVKSHDALADYLDSHPGVKEEYREHPNAFMRDEQRFDRHEDRMMDRDAELHGFGQFLGTHNNIAQQLAKNPKLAQNQEYVANHPDLQAYLQAHPAVQAQLKQNPQIVTQFTQQQNGTPKSTTTTTTPHVDPKPKQ